jgi:hypothetical protein
MWSTQKDAASVPNGDTRTAKLEQAFMKHPSTRELFHYWSQRRGNRPVPDLDEIDPAAIRRVLADTFMLNLSPRLGYPFRLAGTRVCADFGRELKNVPFADLWAAESRQLVGTVLGIIMNESIGVAAGASAHTADGDAIELELLMLPLSQRGHTARCLLGALLPLELPYWLGTSPLGRLTLGTIRYLDPEIDAAPWAPQASGKGRFRRGLVVYEGGRSESPAG